MILLNWTPHPIVLIRDDGTRDTIAPAGYVPRLAEETEPAGELAGVPVVRMKRGGLTSAPPAVPEGAAVIVGDVVADALAAALGVRVYSPDTGPSSVVRDGDGRIAGVRRLKAHDPA